MRLSDADRESLLEALKRHAAAGRLDLQELERRVELIAGAQTREDAVPAIEDLPPLPPEGSAGPVGPSPWWTRIGRGHGHADRPQPDWTPTNERFRDTRTREVMRVWVDAGGGRHYVVDEV